MHRRAFAITTNIFTIWRARRIYPSRKGRQKDDCYSDDSQLTDIARGTVRDSSARQVQAHGSLPSRDIHRRLDSILIDGEDEEEIQSDPSPSKSKTMVSKLTLNGQNNMKSGMQENTGFAAVTIRSDE